jgi:hypothetical protein
MRERASHKVNAGKRKNLKQKRRVVKARKTKEQQVASELAAKKVAAWRGQQQFDVELQKR